MRKYNTIFLDRDGTLNPDPGYISSLDQFEFYDFTIPALQRLAILGKVLYCHKPVRCITWSN
ncbi:MAG: hypothetical protein CM1200mP10_17040 [Candidatus Neomarinimicrobiota bacterium]|nr:MAG: hypothetical protein CM1200mP10_17040 [Candidatus Neomarinimicrobiota bacterium]